MNIQDLTIFFRENRELFFLALSVLMAIFAEGGRRQYKRRKAKACAIEIPKQPEQPVNQGENNGKSI